MCGGGGSGPEDAKQLLLEETCYSKMVAICGMRSAPVEKLVQVDTRYCVVVSKASMKAISVKVICGICIGSKILMLKPEVSVRISLSQRRRVITHPTGIELESHLGKLDRFLFAPLVPVIQLCFIG